MILLTGVTGKTGGAAAKTLLSQGASFRAIVRSPDKAANLAGPGVELIVGDLTDRNVVAEALTGVDKALLVAPNGEQQLDLERQFVECALEAGLKHLVKMSSMEAGPEATSPIPSIHHQCEKLIKGSGLSWTMIRPNFFMQNLLGSGGTIGKQHKFFLPMGDGTTGMSDTRDVGAVIAKVLTSDGHENQSYQLTGPELLSFHDVADRFSEVLGTPIEYVNVPMESYRETLSRFIPSPWHVNAVCALFGEIAEGGLHTTTDTFKELMGREPTSLKQFIEDHIAVYKPS